MTDQEKNVKIALACNWTIKNLGDLPQDKLWINPKGNSVPSGVPNYMGSLDAAAEMRKVLTPEQREDYIQALTDLFPARSNRLEEDWDMIDATPAQQCAAFAKCFTPNLW